MKIADIDSEKLSEGSGRCPENPQGTVYTPVSYTHLDVYKRQGFYQSLCVNTGYYDFLADQTAEIVEMLGDELDGVFFDIVGIRPCWCAACRAEMKERGVDASDEMAVRAFAKMVIDRFKHRMTQLVRSYSKTCTIFYNAGHVGPCTKESESAYSHFELESLPSGGWGYLHFCLLYTSC